MHYFQLLCFGTHLINIGVGKFSVHESMHLISTASPSGYYPPLPLVKIMTQEFKLRVCYNLTAYKVLHLTEIAIRIYTPIYKQWASICFAFDSMKDAEVSFTSLKLAHNLCAPVYTLKFKTRDSLHYVLCGIVIRLFDDNNSIKLRTF